MRSAALLLLVCIGAVPSFAQQSAAPPAPAPVLAPPDTRPLSLRDAIATGIENNTDLAIVRVDPAIAEYEHDATWGLYEPNAYGTFSYESRNIPTANVFTGFGFLQERERTRQAGISGIVPLLGWQYDVGYAYDSLSTTSNIASLSPEQRANLGGSLRAPLLRDFWYGQPWVQVTLSGMQTEVSFEQFRGQLMDIVRGIEDAYWGLSAAEQALEVSEKSLETSKALLSQTQAQYEVGVVSRVEVTEAEAGVADREFRRITVEALYRSAQDRLVDAIYGPTLTATSNIEVETTDPPDQYTTYQLDPAASMARAMEQRPELIAIRKQVEQQEVRLKFAKNQRLPQLDVIGGYTTHGLSGTGQPVSFGTTVIPAPNIPDDYGDSDDVWFSGNNSRSWIGGVRMSIPLGNTTARSNVSINELELRRANSALTRQEQQVVLEVRQAVRNLQAALEGIEAAERRRIASSEQLRAEQIRLEHGESTPFDVLQREEDLVDAERQKIQALAEYHRSVAALDRAQGTILEDRGVAVEKALSLR